MNSVIIINGSPRKDGNTAKMCRAFAEGVKLQLQDATVETVNLYDFDSRAAAVVLLVNSKVQRITAIVLSKTQ